ncbi:NUDIX hydrolase [Acidisphaera rubrifaciens]|nr:NUDIX domain-containing protein [Acidisphaera rubrifaciens]
MSAHPRPDAAPSAPPAGNAAPFLRHIAACRTAVLPGRRLEFVFGGVEVGFVAPALADRLRTMDGFTVAGGRVACAGQDALDAALALLWADGTLRRRGEAFDIRADHAGPSLGTIDRGALPAFGIAASGVHVNGLVERPDGLHVWIAKRAADKPTDPGKLDHVTAGGIPAGLSPAATLVKEAAEEAAIPPDLATAARPVGVIAYAMERPEGLRRDRLYCYDLTLPDGFEPRPADGEAAWFALWPAARVLAAVRDTDDFKFNVSVVLIDLFVRRGLIEGPAAAMLRAALDRE